MKEFLEGLGKIDPEFQACSPESTKQFAEPLWAKKKIEIEALMKEKLATINKINTPKELEDYQENGINE